MRTCICVNLLAVLTSAMQHEMRNAKMPAKRGPLNTRWYATGRLSCQISGLTNGALQSAQRQLQSSSPDLVAAHPAAAPDVALVQDGAARTPVDLEKLIMAERTNTHEKLILPPELIEAGDCRWRSRRSWCVDADGPDPRSPPAHAQVDLWKWTGATIQAHKLLFDQDACSFTSSFYPATCGAQGASSSWTFNVEEDQRNHGVRQTENHHQTSKHKKREATLDLQQKALNP